MMLGIPYQANARVKRPGGSSRAEIVKPAGRPPVKPKEHIVPVKAKKSFGPSIDEQFERTNTETS
jgi:hypothetical protein